MVICYRHVYVLYGLHDSTYVYIFFLMFHLWFCLILLDVKINLYQYQCQCMLHYFAYCIYYEGNFCGEVTYGEMSVWQLYCIVLYCIIKPYTDGPIGPLSYRHSSGVVRNPHSALAE